MKPNYNHEEFQAWSLNDQTSLKSAQAYISGFYALDEAESDPIYPYAVENTPPLYSLPFVRTNTDLNWNQYMMLKGYDEDLCPFIQEVRDYELRDKTVTHDMMRQLDMSFNEWVRDKHEFLNFNEEGELINELPPILTNFSDQIGFVREVLQRKRENRFMPYDIQQYD